VKQFNIALGLAVSIFSGNSLAAEPVKLVIPEVKHDVSETLKSMASTVQLVQPAHRVVPLYRKPLKLKPIEGTFIDEAIQPNVTLPLVATPGLSFLGLGAGFPNFEPSISPPDPNASVGLTQIVQWVNASFAVFDKATGTLVMGPTAGNALWAGFGGPCQNQNSGDPIVKYDQLANRWVMTQFAVEDKAHQTQCIAVSTTSDATGPYYRYAFDFGTNFNDYGKLGVWPDAYYMMFAMFPADVLDDDEGFAPAIPTQSGPAACAFDRNSMLTGSPATMQCFQPQPAAGFFLPSDLDGKTLPHAGEPNYFVGLLQDANGVTDRHHLAVWKFHVDWQNPNNSTFMGPTALRVKEFNPTICNKTPDNADGDCAVQQGTNAKLDVISDRPMYRLAYRNLGSHQSLVFNHVVQTGNQIPATRWYEFRVNYRGNLTVHQQGTYTQPDGNGRWMGSIAMDKQGNMALGFSVSGPALFPSIHYTGRKHYDPRDRMRGENIIMNGGGHQLPSAPGKTNRWGDYSSMAIDPSDDCTFWYTNEFLQESGKDNWSTQIASFKYPECK